MVLALAGRGDRCATATTVGLLLVTAACAIGALDVTGWVRRVVSGRRER